MSGYTEMAWDYDTSEYRQILNMSTFLLHLGEQSEDVLRLGFTLCGCMVPHLALVDGEIPSRFVPPICQKCAKQLERREAEELETQHFAAVESREVEG